MLYFILTLLWLLIIFCLYILIRNVEVFYYRNEMLIKDKLDELPSYNKMLLNFWVWPLSKFNKK